MATRKYRRSIDTRFKQVTEAQEVLNGIDKDWLYELQRRHEALSGADGYSSSSMGDGGSSSSDDTSTTERAALRGELNLPGCRRPSFVKVKGYKRPVCTRCGFNANEHSADPIGNTVEQIMDLLDSATQALRTIEKKYAVVIHAADGRRGRETDLSQCLACGKDVTGYGNDRIRSGYCPACYTAWLRYKLRLGPNAEPSHVVFRQTRAGEIAAAVEEQPA